MNLETRARDAAESLRTATPVDTGDGLRRLHRIHQRRTTGKVIAAVAAVVVGVGVVQVQVDEDRTAPPVSPPPGHWVLVAGSGVGGVDNPVQPRGYEWAEPLAKTGVQSYPNFRSANPATQRFLVQDMDATAWYVMTPGKRDPVVTFDCPPAEGCLMAALGPGPDELTTMGSAFGPLVVVGPDGQRRRAVGSVWMASAPALGFVRDLTWSPDGETWAETRVEHLRDEGSLAVVLRAPDSSKETTLYEYTEAAPPWYDAEEHRFGDGPGEFNDWGAPQVVDLRWAPDSTRLAFATETAPAGGGGGERHVQWQLFVADAATGGVEQIADLGRCAEPVDENGRHARLCDEQDPALAWTPDGKGLAVLSDSTLTTYDQTGEVLSSQSTDLKGPIVWVTSK